MLLASFPALLWDLELELERHRVNIIIARNGLKFPCANRWLDLMLFDCVKRTQEQEEESDGLEQEQVHSKRRRFEADPNSLTPECQVPSINHL